jgi:SAM-dependent methyltransferase
MERDVYQRMAELEQEHWWFVARRRILADLLPRWIAGNPARRILEAGCGTGGNLAMLSKLGEVVAFEPDDMARQLARRHGAFEIRRGFLPDDIPYGPESFEVVAALDVLEHVDDDVGSLKAMASRLRPGGHLVLTVPAFPSLWSRHDECHHHKRRYRRRELLARIAAAGLAPVRVTYFNSWLLPLIAFVRFGKAALRLDDRGDETMPPRLLNRMLTVLFASERYVLRLMPLPIGVSLLAVARKAGA